MVHCPLVPCVWGVRDANRRRGGPQCWQRIGTMSLQSKRTPALSIPQVSLETLGEIDVPQTPRVTHTSLIVNSN